ncbi:polysaccharide lyase 8 family protein [Streptomyces sp. NPDC001941]|uniref:polysaccharide lyase 8 family protein n=1 Tax=Streptomyces sp. NPDC001941 TaxID=3154659 RepID=UPI00332C94CF
MSRPWSRRSFLVAAGGATLALVPLPSGPLFPTRTAFAADDEFARLRTRWRELQLGGGFDAGAEPFRTKLADLGAQARDFADRMSPAATSLWPDLVFRTPDNSANVTGSCNRLRTMAQAWAQPGTGSTGDAGLLASVLTGLDQLYARVYREDQTAYGNWWDWQIGSPQALLDTAVLVHASLSATQKSQLGAAIDHFVPDSAVASSTGANRVDLCRVLAVRGLLGDSAAKLASARDALSPVFPYVTTGDGLYRDGSFVQHTNIAYTGTYGTVLLGGVGLLLAALAGSTWAITDPQRQVVLDAVERAWAPFLYNGLVMDNVSGRAVSRGVAASDPERLQQDDHRRGHAVLASVLLLGQGASAAENARWRALVKGWAQRDYYSPPTGDRSLGVAALARLRDVLDDTSVTAAPEPVGHWLFSSMARATHRRPGWAASVSMADKRISYYETGNGENPRGWHTGSGMLTWWGADFANGQYSDAFWPTVDPYRLPGTTTSRKRLADGEGGAWANKRPDAGWVGGATDGTYGAVGQHLKALSSTLQARKSWFFLDDGIVCLGAGISCADGTPVDSVVDNRNLGTVGGAPLTVDGVVQPSAYPWSATASASWAHLGGHAGYVFPSGGTLALLREERSGRWSDINTGGDGAVLSRRYATLYVDHGTDPVDASYAYVLMPGATAQRTAARAADHGWLDLLANTGAAQGIRVPSLGVTAVNFWAAGTAGPLTADGPCSVLVHEHGDGTASVCVSDPPRERTALTVTWRRAVASVRSAPPTVRAATPGATLTLEFGSLTGQAGVTQEVVVALA